MNLGDTTATNRGPWRELRALLAVELFGLAIRADVQATLALAQTIVDQYNARSRP